MVPVLKVAVTGPESTGKSLLCRELAGHFNTVYVPEYAREYVDRLNRPYCREDILAIARQQIAMEDTLKDAANRYLFCDTELIVAKIWELHKYNECHPWILKQIENRRYDLYLLCDIDLPWEPDPQREYPHMREFFFDWFRRELEGYGFPYFIVSGSRDERTDHAIRSVRSYFNKG